MKRLILVFLLVTTFQIARGQYIQNKLDVGVSAISVSPRGSKTVEGIPALYSNYQGTIGFMLTSRYKVKDGFGVGLDYLSMSFDNNQIEEFPSISFPKSSFNTLLVSLSYISGRRFEYGAKTSAGLTAHRLQIAHLIIPAENRVVSSQRVFRETEFAMSASLLLGYHLSSEFKLTTELAYVHTIADNLLYIDNAFRSIVLSVGLTKKLLKNRLFQYE